MTEEEKKATSRKRVAQDKGKTAKQDLIVPTKPAASTQARKPAARPVAPDKPKSPSERSADLDKAKSSKAKTVVLDTAKATKTKAVVPEKAKFSRSRTVSQNEGATDALKTDEPKTAKFSRAQTGTAQAKAKAKARAPKATKVTPVRPAITPLSSDDDDDFFDGQDATMLHGHYKDRDDEPSKLMPKVIAAVVLLAIGVGVFNLVSQDKPDVVAAKEQTKEGESEGKTVSPPPAKKPTVTAPEKKPTAPIPTKPVATEEPEEPVDPHEGETWHDAWSEWVVDVAGHYEWREVSPARDEPEIGHWSDNDDDPYTPDVWVIDTPAQHIDAVYGDVWISEQGHWVYHDGYWE
jgi:hypothetical protein